jgi:hypothetical protein
LGRGPKKLKKVGLAEIGAGPDVRTAQGASDDVGRENEGKCAGLARGVAVGVLRRPAALAAYV